MAKLRNINEILCTDVFLELFQYFYVDELFQSFMNIIPRFSTLLIEEHVHLHVRSIDGHFRRRILPYIALNNVKSIRIQNMYQMAPVNLSRFNQVRLLELRNVTKFNWPDDFPDDLKYLIIHVRSKHRQEVFEKALALKNIERLEFHSTFLHFHDSDDKLNKSSSIRHLTFHAQRSFINYQFLLNNMPDLQVLRAINTYYPHGLQEHPQHFRYLHTMDLVCRYMDITKMISFLTSIALHSLRRCRIVNINSSLLTGIAKVLISC